MTFGSLVDMYQHSSLVYKEANLSTSKCVCVCVCVCVCARVCIDHITSGPPCAQMCDTVFSFLAIADGGRP